MKAFIRLLLLTALAVPITAMAQGQAQQDLKASLTAEKMAPQELMYEHGANFTTTFQQTDNSVNGPAYVPPRRAANITPIPSAGTVTRKSYEVNTGTKTICDGTNTNANIPIDVNRLYLACRGQMIYPKSILGLESGVRIKAITFYANGNLTTSPWYGSEYNPVTIKLGNTTTNSYTSNSESNYINNLTEGSRISTILNGTNSVTFTLDEPFTYTGDNLVVDLSCEALSSAYYRDRSWYGQNQNNYTSLYTSNQSRRRQFLAKIKIDYEYDVRTDYQAELPVSGDTTFFAQFDDFTWRVNGTGAASTAKLTDVATDPDHIIALLKTIYTTKEIPGNWKRGFDGDGNDEPWNDVAYTGVGTISHTGNSYNNASYYSYANDYGWNISGDMVYGYDSDWRAHYAHMDSTQYKPDQDGLTLLLCEVVDDYDKTTFDAMMNSATFGSSYEMLRTQIASTIKSVRLVTQSKRTGEGENGGILFKIDCDKMNKFFLIAKGQMRYLFNSRNVFNDEQHYYPTATFCRLPLYAYSDYTNVNYLGGEEHIGGFLDDNCYEPLYHMFEQFSPYESSNQAEAVLDLYQNLVNMESFPVPHDCASIPAIYPKGHHFRMYGEDSEAKDCQDVRDLMFFIPDYRMMDDGTSRDTNNGGTKFLNYNTAHQPTMGLFVIRQDTVSCPMNARHDDYYKLTLTWDSNLDEFLPSDQQEYHLLQVVQDEFGHDVYVPVYYTDEQGRYLDGPNGQPLANQNDTLHWVPIILQFSPSANKKTYTDVYVLRSSGSQQVTYAIQGQDTDGHGNHFLTLQISNRQSYIIPGKDPAEMILLSDATHYSRFNPANQTNCYSNKLKIANNPQGVKSEYLADGTKFTFKRMTSPDDNAPVTIAEATVSGAGEEGGILNIQLYAQAPKSAFPAGKSEGIGAGYHHNEGGVDVLEWNHPYTFKDNGDVDFGKFIIFDNFVADVSANEHPNQYFYKVEFETATQFTGLNGQTNSAYSNSFRIPVYKTDSRINATYDKAAIDADGATATTARMTLPENVQFDEQVQRSSKTEILRYDAYRWNSENANDFFIIDEIGDEDEEQDLPPDGLAGNQGESYTVSMNAVGTPNYTTSEVSVAGGSGWAEFVDKVPNSGGASPYTYAPVVESFTSGLNVKETAVRTDYNTYGGPLQKVAVGKVDIKQPSNNDMMASDYEWEEEGVTYCYYNVPIHINSVTLPGDEGAYEVYKVRAWRIADETKLHEREPNGTTIPNRRDRLSGDYLFEELTYGQEFDVSGGVRKSALQNYDLGGRARSGGDSGETMATFGAVKLAAGETRDINFIVRVYFTKVTASAPQGGSGAGAPRRALTAENLSADGKYYVAEGTTTATLSDQIVTGLGTVKAQREAIGVAYINTIGQVSSTPWQGVYIIVTRYSDGSTTTTKVIR